MSQNFELIFRKDQILLELFFSLEAIVLKKKLSIMGGQNGKRIELYTGMILMVLMFLKTMMVCRPQYIKNKLQKVDRLF